MLCCDVDDRKSEKTPENVQKIKLRLKLRGLQGAETGDSLLNKNIIVMIIMTSI